MDPGGIRRRFRTVKLFAPTFTPWEVEEIGSIWKYVIGHCRCIIAEVDTDMHLRSLSPLTRESFGGQEESRNQTRRSSPYLDAYDSEEATDSLVSLGLDFLKRVLGAESYEKRRDLVLSYIVESGYYRSFRLAYDSVGLPSLLVYPADTFEDERVLDALSSLPEAEQPSEGWRWYCSVHDIPALGVGPDMWDVEGIRSLSLYDYPELLDWGYVLWDRKRLEEWNVVVAMPAKKKKRRKAKRLLSVGHTLAVDACT